MNKALREQSLRSDASETLDPRNWDEIRALGHRMLDDMIDHVANVRERPVWQSIPDAVRARFREALPHGASDLSDVYREFSDHIAPYATGNVHPGFMGWVHGGGSAVGMLAEMLAAGLNANLGGRDHMPIEVERQIVGMDAGAVRLSRHGERHFRHRHIDGEPHGCAGGADVGARRRGAAIRRGGRGRLAAGLHVEGRAWLHHQGDGYRGSWQRCAALHRC